MTQPHVYSRNLVQIKSLDENRALEFLDIWTTIIPAQDSSSILNHLKANLPEEPHSLNHLRRLVKDESVSSTIRLKMVICSVDCLPDMDKVQQLLRSCGSYANDLVVTKGLAPRYQARTKEIAAEWSAVSWPIMWRGNPAAIETELQPMEIDNITKYLEILTNLASQHPEEELGIATLIVDPEQDKILATTLDSRRKQGNPLRHSIMCCVEEIAKREYDRRKRFALHSNAKSSLSSSSFSLPAALSSPDANTVTESPSPPSSVTSSTDAEECSEEQNYLCLNLHVYTTHEPCPMCAMTLVHSRIGRLVYIESSPKTGAIEPTSAAGYAVHWHKQLNWRYEAWKWNNDPDNAIFKVDSLPEDVNV